MSKVSIIGVGEVGASCATCLAERDFMNEIWEEWCGAGDRIGVGF